MFEEFELVAYLLLTGWALWQLRKLFYQRPFMTVNNARSVLFTVGMLIFVMRYWWLTLMG